MAAKRPRKPDPGFAAAIAQVAPALAAWRERRTHRQPIPEALWRKMALLARRYGLSPVAQALRVNYNGLKRRLMAASPGSAGAVDGPAPAFIELPATGWSNSPQWVIELEDRSGCKLTLRLPTSERAGALALVQGLWEHRA